MWSFGGHFADHMYFFDHMWSFLVAFDHTKNVVILLNAYLLGFE
ncbi:hypothetical protein HMPREF9104_01921 [Lentilactobacillus kisonensis F0435]|uniref:Uncharacterized protein n=1 Tax=Lentilactobacillus kisonensis F0435 TaxID=797516 RepID=H1LH31_9LACO|nr:hypothetical protein HMPREF9104_01921 [Lentilactobacillus kisonensis F0435]